MSYMSLPYPEILPGTIIKSHPQLVAMIMVKNEADTIQLTLHSLVGIVDKIFILDTGCTDDTVMMCHKWGRINNVDVFLDWHTFDDFSSSRNYMLYKASQYFQKGTLLLLLDAADTLEGNPRVELTNMLQKKGLFDSDEPGFYLNQKWETDGKVESFKNIRLIKSGMGWHYTGSVHEFISTPDCPDMKNIATIPNVVIRQIRTPRELEKTEARLLQDEKMLDQMLLDGKDVPRNTFYLAQTKSILKKYQEAFLLYKKRSTLGGWVEETYVSKLRMGELALLIQPDKIPTNLLLDAFKYSFSIGMPRIESVVYLVDCLFQKKEYKQAQQFSRMIQEIPYPDKAILFVKDSVYSHMRYHQYALLCILNQNDWQGGRKAHLEAVKAGFQQDKEMGRVFAVNPEIEALLNKEKMGGEKKDLGIKKKE